MRSRTLANEKTRSFYTRLKRSYLFGWYWPKLGTSTYRLRLSNRQRTGQFKIDQIAFFNKHFWFHFNEASINGWIPVKDFRKNYCRLNLRTVNVKGSAKIDSQLACAIMLCKYVQPRSDTNQIKAQYNRHRPQTVDDWFTIVADQIGRFKNVSHKSMRRLRSQIWHQRPIVMALTLNRHIKYVVIIGFNRRVFSYVSPEDDQLRFITRKRLIKAWQRCGYRAFSC